MHMSRELKSGLFFFGLSLLVLRESLRVELGTFVEPGSGFLTFGAGLALCTLSIVLICRGWKVREPHKPISRRVALALASLFAYSLVLSFLGFAVATFFLVGVLFYLGQPRKWWLLIGMSALVTLVAYLVFGVLLHVYFPRGLFGI
jgi:putative tricarboxylic transport membrane protein